MKTIVLASNNSHKIEEFKTILKDYNIVTMNEVGFTDDIVEDGSTFLENSLIKARALIKFLNEQNKPSIVIADDSGLCVNTLDGAPGIYSARYAGNHDFKANRNKLLKDLENKTDRTAYFVCLLVVMNPDGSFSYVEGKTFGQITKEELGKTDFGYDCLFYSNELKKTFGQASDKEKNSVSHRGRAIAKLLEEKIL